MPTFPAYTISSLSNELTTVNVDTVDIYLIADVDYGDGAGYVTNKVSVDTLTQRITSASASFLQNFSTSTNNSTPNVVIAANKLLVRASTDNADLVLSPKGNGAMLAQVPDNTVTGGNKRGLNAVDLQTARGNADQVASGLSSFTVGRNNKASGPYSVALGAANNSTGSSSSTALGLANTASGTYSVAMGNENTASNIGAVALGNTNISSGVGSFSVGLNNIASGNKSIAMGEDNKADGVYSLALGYRADTKGVGGKYAFASGYFTQLGDTQLGRQILRASTTSDTAVLLTSNNLASNALNQVRLVDNQAILIIARVLALSDTGVTKAFELKGVARRRVGEATVTISNFISDVIHQESGAANWTVLLEADTINGCCSVKFQTNTVVNVRCTAEIQTLELTY
jgi:hypothetical protein